MTGVKDKETRGSNEQTEVRKNLYKPTMGLDCEVVGKLLRQPEVRNFENNILLIVTIVHHNIFWFEVPMHKVMAVEICETGYYEVRTKVNENSALKKTILHTELKNKCDGNTLREFDVILD